MTRREMLRERLEEVYTTPGRSTMSATATRRVNLHLMKTASGSASGGGFRIGIYGASLAQDLEALMRVPAFDLVPGVIPGSGVGAVCPSRVWCPSP